MLEHLTARQLAEWAAYDVIDPIGPEREDYRISYLAKLINNMFISAYSKEGATLSTIEDHWFNWDVEAFMAKQDEEQEKLKAIKGMKNFLLSFAKSHNEKLSKDEMLKKKNRK